MRTPEDEMAMLRFSDADYALGDRAGEGRGRAPRRRQDGLGAGGRLRA